MKNCLIVFLVLFTTCGLYAMEETVQEPVVLTKKTSKTKKTVKSTRPYLHLWDSAVQPFVHYDYDQSNNLLTIDLENVHVVCTDLPGHAEQTAQQIALMQPHKRQYDYIPQQRKTASAQPSGKLIGRYFTGGSTAGQSDLMPTRRQECKIYLKKQV